MFSLVSNCISAKKLLIRMGSSKKTHRNGTKKGKRKNKKPPKKNHQKGNTKRRSRKIPKKHLKLTASKQAKISEIKQHTDFLSLITDVKSKKRANKLLSLANKGELEALSACLHNACAGALALPEKVLRKLVNKRSLLKKLLKKGVKINSKRRLIQKGGFLPIIASLLPFIIKLIKK